ncbi:uncharacterized protein LOC124177031 [Neodiprion fabricii]|uniref:uncharacterized protein LOC124177031 n=1 Tax=Neodiprion fabricii TaxID=2872261 RepID=UPI001ED8DBE5|nr:uncharacterized protein LOC124177031 [Neodiprion fabricii]
MVCKENVVSWFGNLSSYKRIDVMCTLLNMCLPFEVRYLGTCVEDLGKRDYNDLRDTEHKANNASDLAELTSLGVTDKRTRRKLSLYMALLHSCNYACAVILYNNLSNVDFQEIVNLLNGATFIQDDQTLDELLLLYTMALNHPAFTYEQKSVFGNIYAKLQEEEVRLNPPKAAINLSFRSAQGSAPCVTSNEKVMDNELLTNCLVPPPPMQPFHGDMSARSNALLTGLPPGLTMPPPGPCFPAPEQMSIASNAAAQYLQLGFPSMNHMPPWAGQVMLSNPMMYHQAGDTLAYSSSPLVSHQSSPSQSRSPSRSNSPMNNRSRNPPPRTSSTQITHCAASAVTTSASTGSSQTSTSSSLPSLQPVSSTVTVSCSKSQSSLLLPQWSVPPPTAVSATSSLGNSRHGNTEGLTTAQTSVTTSKQTSASSARIRSTASADSLRETLGKEMPSFKNSLQNFSIDEIRRMGDDELRDLGLPSNAVGQLRSIVKGQTSNGLNLLPSDKKFESLTNTITHPLLDHVENEMIRTSETGTGTKCIPLHQQQQQILHHHHHNLASSSVKRYPTISPMDPSPMQIYPPPPPVYAAQNTPCYACLTMPVNGMQNRYPRYNAQQVCCLAHLEGLRTDPESSRHFSHSSSSESTGSRSPPETPPAVPWAVGGVGESSVPNNPSLDHTNPGLTSSHPTSTTPVLSNHHQAALQQGINLPQVSEKQQRNSRKNPGHYVRHKNQHHMMNGGPPSIPHCLPFPPQASHSQITYLQHGGHFPSLRPAAGIYSNHISQPAYARPTYPMYQPNGEVVYHYQANHLGHHPGSGGTPPPVAQPLSQTSYLPPTPVVTYSTVVPPPKVSCYNCGSSTHHAADCKDQTMEDLTKGAQYRLDYTILKQPAECPSSDK